MNILVVIAILLAAFLAPAAMGYWLMWLALGREDSAVSRQRRRARGGDE